MGDCAISVNQRTTKYPCFICKLDVVLPPTYSEYLRTVKVIGGRKVHMRCYDERKEKYFADKAKEETNRRNNTLEQLITAMEASITSSSERRLRHQLNNQSDFDSYTEVDINQQTIDWPELGTLRLTPFSDTEDNEDSEEGE